MERVLEEVKVAGCGLGGGRLGTAEERRDTPIV